MVEDEPAVREGLVVLLKAWGAGVTAFESVEAVEAWLAEAPPGPSAPPDLLIVDYRLPEGRTGLQALAAYFRPSRTAFQRDRGRRFSLIADAASG